MIGKLLKQNPTVRLHDDDIKFDLNCAYCVNLKQDVMILHHWKKVYEKSAKESVKAKMLSEQLFDTISQMKKDKDEDAAYIIEQRMTIKEYEGAYNQLREQSKE